MRHMIVHHSTDGAAIYHETDDLDSAVRLVEHLRNVDNVTDARIYSLHEVPIEFRPYYRVEVATAPLLPSVPAWPDVAVEPLPVPEALAPPVMEVQAVEEGPAPEPSEFAPPSPVPSASTRFGLFSRG